MKKINNYVIRYFGKTKKLIKPSSRLFTSMKNLKKNKEYLKMPMREILSLPNCKKLEKNIQTIKLIYEDPEKAKEAYVALENSLEDEIKLFYESEYFQEFKNSSKTKLFELKFILSTKISLVEKYGYIKYFKTVIGENSIGIKKNNIKSNT